MYIHTRESNITYDLFHPQSEDDYLDSDWVTGAIYYAELVVAEALSGSSIVVDLNLDNSMTSPSSSVAGYAIYDGSDHSKDKLVLFNYAYPTSSGQNTTQDFVIPAKTASSVAVRYLLAENVTEQSAITWAGQTVDGNGDLTGTQALATTDCTNGCTISVPGPGLAVIWLDATSQTQSKKIFKGNSTVAGVYNGSSTTAPVYSITRTIQDGSGGTQTSLTPTSANASGLASSHSSGGYGLINMLGRSRFFAYSYALASCTYLIFAFF